MIPYKQITIDLVPEVMPPEPLLTASQYDNGRPVEVTVQYGGEDYDLTGMTAKIQVRKPSGKVVIADAAQVSGSKVVFNLITQMTAEYGQILTELSLTGQDQEPIGTANWITYVEKSPASGSPSDTWVQDIDEKVEQATEAAEAAEQSQLWAEAWAVGERDGEPVPETDPTYENNAKYYALSSTSAKEAAEAAASAAVESARSAADSATDASGSAESASGSATASAGSASAAAGSATAAASSASAAAQSAGQSAASATESAGYATASENSAGVSAGAAEAAGQSATAAAGSASTAAGHATNAANSATASAGSATQSANSATASATSAGQAASSATAAAGSATEADASADRAQEILDSIPEDYTELSEDVADLKSAMSQVETMSSAAFITEDASGAVVAISDGADGVPSKGYTLNIEPHQAGSGDPSPDNVRPITGYTSVDVTRAGKNLCINQPAIAAQTVVLLDGKTKAYSNLVISMHVTNLVFGDNTAAFGRIFHGDSLTPVRYYTFNSAHKSDGSNFTVNGTPYTGIVYFNVGAIEEGINRINMYPYPTSYAKWSGTIDWCVISFIDGEIVTEYEPYQANTESIPFPSEAGTVYGGTLAKNADGSGTLTVTMARVDVGTLNWNYVQDSTFNMRASDDVGAAPAKNTSTAPNAICSKLPVLDYTTISGGVVGITVIFAQSAQAGKIWAHSELTDVNAFKEEMSGAYLVYELANPSATYTIPAEDMAKIPTLKGDNTVWMSADGTIDLEYCADPKMYISKLITPIQTNIAYLETGTTASRAYTAGQYVIVGDVLHRVAASIASGATFTPGTNIVQTTVGGELTALNA